jgi:thiamine kinase-like enzyme
MSESTLRSLPIWQGEITIEPLSGGLTNLNYRVIDGDRCFAARTGQDDPDIGILRSNELSCTRAAALQGIAPTIAYSAPGVLVCEFITDATTLTPELIRDPSRLRRIVPSIQAIHAVDPGITDRLQHFSPFAIAHKYLEIARSKGLTLPTHCDQDLANTVQRLQGKIQPYTPTFTHNDMMPGNFLDTGDRIWVIDWEYSGTGHPLFDLAGLSSNCDFDEDLDQQLTSMYGLSESAFAEFRIMKAMAALRESLWAVVQGSQTAIDFDYNAYRDDNYNKFTTYELAAR